MRACMKSWDKFCTEFGSGYMQNCQYCSGALLGMVFPAPLPERFTECLETVELQRQIPESYTLIYELVRDNVSDK